MNVYILYKFIFNRFKLDIMKRIEDFLKKFRLNEGIGLGK
jgi:hypothetical protein